MQRLLRGVFGTVWALPRTAQRAAVIAVLVAAAWDDDGPVPDDPLITP